MLSLGMLQRKDLLYEVEIDPGLSQRILGDPRRVRQVLSNLIANAMQHTKEGKVAVEAYHCPNAQPQPGKVEVEIVVDDSGAGMSQSKVDALFRELEEVSYEEDLADTMLITKDVSTDPPPSDTAALGLGLAVVARTIRNMNGQLRVKTEEGKGSRFVIVLVFDTDGSQPAQLEHQPSPAKDTSRPATSSGQHEHEGEVTLVYRNPQKGPETPSPLLRRESAESVNSLKSAHSARSDMSQKSDAERLIDAIQQPLHLSEQRLTSPGPVAGKTPRRTSLESSVTAPKSKSLPSPRDLKSAFRSAGSEKIKDSGTPLRPVRVPDDQQDEASGSKMGPRVLFEEPESSGGTI